MKATGTSSRESPSPGLDDCVADSAVGCADGPPPAPLRPAIYVLDERAAFVSAPATTGR